MDKTCKSVFLKHMDLATPFENIT